MRIYEFSKQSNIPVKALLSALQEAGFKVSSHMSALTQTELDFLYKKFEIKSTESDQKTSDVVVSKEQEGGLEDFPAKSAQDIDVQKVEQENDVVVVEAMSPADVSEKMDKPVNEIILTLLRWGIAATKNKVLSEDIIARLAEHYQLKVVKPVEKEKKIEKEIIVEKEKLAERLPIVVVFGHVDHGKTTLLDFIRRTRIVSREKGGITQHLGAYEASTPHGNVVFLDTPGHEAFAKMRMRGIRTADIAILVIAADDGIMPQTVEAIKYARSVDVPIIVAINKIDKVDEAQIEKIKREMAQYDLLPEEWGGDVICAPISAKTGQGVDQLLEMVILQAQIMELRADITSLGRGYILEARLEKGRGPVATLLCQHGKVRIGDFFACGNTFGKVNSLIDSYGRFINEVGPSIPVQVAGFDSLPEAGDYFKIVSRNEFRKIKLSAQKRKIVAPKRIITEGAINLIIKTDTDSSKEALSDAIHKLSAKFEKGFNIIYAGIGDVNESNVVLASNTNSRIIAFYVKSESNAILLAQQHVVPIYKFDIIYKALEELEKIAESAKEVKIVLTKIGEAVVRRVFNIKGIGVIAGCYVKDGRFSREGSVIVWRDNKKIGEGKIKSLQRENKTVKEVHAGFECAFLIENFEDWTVDDKVECFIETPEVRKE